MEIHIVTSIQSHLKLVFSFHYVAVWPEQIQWIYSIFGLLTVLDAFWWCYHHVSVHWQKHRHIARLFLITTEFFFSLILIVLNFSLYTGMVLNLYDFGKHHYAICFDQTHWMVWIIHENTNYFLSASPSLV